MFIKNLTVAALLAVSLGAAAQTQPQTLKPCFVQVSPTVWVDMNNVAIISATPDGTNVELQFRDGKSLALAIPADQALNYVKKATSYAEQCRKS